MIKTREREREDDPFTVFISAHILIAHSQFLLPEVQKSPKIAGCFVGVRLSFIGTETDHK